MRCVDYFVLACACSSGLVCDNLMYAAVGMKVVADVCWYKHEQEQHTTWPLSQTGPPHQRAYALV